MHTPTPEIIRQATLRKVEPLPGEPSPLPALPNMRNAGSNDMFALTDAAVLSHRFDIMSRETVPRSSGWAIAWSDLMMTMFVMFAALYIFQMPKKVPVLSDEKSPLMVLAPRTEVSPGSILDRIHDGIRDVIDRNGLEPFLRVRLVPEKSVHITSVGDSLFGAGTAALKTAGKNQLLGLTGILRSAPHAVAVVGHVVPGEPLGDFADPWKLSMARAAEVAAFLMREGGLPANRVLLVGYGDRSPSAGEAGQVEIRRLEIVLSTEVPTDPLPSSGGQAGGFREWLAASRQGV